ncbi:sterol desaturase family protein [Bacterioplanoides sp.]|uniref:sterol desaturase family protein n=1 Tax=Bacterioplanoides sp. TaxID=2066072 RepID=UPI003B58CE97
MEDLIRALAFIFGAGAVFILLMFLEAWYMHRKTGHSGYYIKETLANLTTGASYKIVDGIAIALFITAFADVIAPYGLQWNPEPSLLTFVILFVLADFFMYVNHFAMHKLRWFWVVHVTHHSSEHMNLSTALRQNFLNALNGNWLLMWVPLALIGFDKDWILIAIEANLFYQFFMHTEAVGRLGWAEKIFNTPSHHRVHHGSNPEQIDRNFGGVFIIWDRLFGTFRDEDDAGEIKYGVTRMPEKPLNPFYIQTYELASMLKDVWRYKDLRILYKHPDWVLEKYGEQ